MNHTKVWLLFLVLLTCFPSPALAQSSWTTLNEVGSVDTPGYAYSLATQDGYAYVADRSYGLRVIDISNPAGPREVGSYCVAGDVATRPKASDVIVEGSMAYVAYNEAGLLIVDVTDKTRPTLAYSLPLPGSATGLVKKSATLYVSYAETSTGQSSGFAVINATNPASPSIIGTFTAHRPAHGIDVSGNYAYLAESDYGLSVVDISNPTRPWRAARYRHTPTSSSSPDNVSGVKVVDNYAYVANW